MPAATLDSSGGDVNSALPVLMVGVTGHRDVRDADVPGAMGSIRTLLQELQDVTSERARLIAASPLAGGADQLFALEAQRTGVELIAPLPKMRDAYRATLGDRESERLFDALLAEHRSFYVGDWKESPSLRKDLPTAEGAYERLGDMLDSTCAVLVAVWDGVLGGAPGGTGDTVARRLARDPSPAPTFWVPLSRRSPAQSHPRTRMRPGFIRSGPRPEELTGISAEDIYRRLRLACASTVRPADEPGIHAIRNRLGRAAELMKWLLHSAPQHGDLHQGHPELPT